MGVERIEGCLSRIYSFTIQVCDSASRGFPRRDNCNGVLGAASRPFAQLSRCKIVGDHE